MKLTGLYAIADTRCLDDARLLPAVRAAIDGGASLVQYRDKGVDATRRERQAHALALLCRQTGTTFVINDDVALAKAVSANGVHIGRHDKALTPTRAELGPQMLVGVSCYNELARALQAQAEGADYVAFGSFFWSVTKPGAVRATVELLREARQQLRIPIVAIGGITPENGASLITAGADALAAIDGLFGQSDVAATAARYRRLF